MVIRGERVSGNRLIIGKYVGVSGMQTKHLPILISFSSLGDAILFLYAMMENTC